MIIRYQNAAVAFKRSNEFGLGEENYLKALVLITHDTAPGRSTTSTCWNLKDNRLQGLTSSCDKNRQRICYIIHPTRQQNFEIRLHLKFENHETMKPRRQSNLSPLQTLTSNLITSSP
jgi:hypothetical protein